MLDLNNKSVSLVGYGVSNKALCRYLMKRGVVPTVRAPQACDLPKGMTGVFGDGYLNTEEDVVFRSPGVCPSGISKRGEVYTEARFALEKIKSKCIGITGSDGKTTTSTLVYRMLCQGGKNAFLCGNIGLPIIDLCDSVGENDVLVAELSSFQLCDMCPVLDVAVITNITQNHLDWHTDMDDYIQAKANILKNARRCVLNYDDPVLRTLCPKGGVYFSLKDCRSLLCSQWDFAHVCDGNVCYNNEVLFPVSEIRLKGRFNVYNVLSAIGCVYGTVDTDSIRKVAREFLGVDNRMEAVAEINGVEFINSAIDTTPSRTNATLSAFDLERVILIVGGYDKHLSYGVLKDVLTRAKAVVALGENRDKIAEASCGRHIINVNTLKEAVQVAYSLASRGDFVILSPASASFDMFKNYKEKAKCFKEAVKGLVNGED